MFSKLRIAGIPVRPSAWWVAVLACTTLVMLCCGTAVLAQNPAPVHAYELDGSLADSLGGPSLEAIGGGLGARRHFFRPNDGLRVQGALPNPAHYSIEMVFRFTVDAQGTGWNRILDWSGLTSDCGLYYPGQLAFKCAAYGPGSVLPLGMDGHLVVTRDGASNTMSFYVGGTLNLSFNDSSGHGIANGNQLYFFLDDGAEEGTGSVASIRIYDRPLSASEVAQAHNAADADHDGAFDEDNCPQEANPDQNDADLDGIGDACDGYVNSEHGPIPIDEGMYVHGACETIAASFTALEAVTTNLYSGYVEIGITGSGQSALTCFNDAFWIYTCGLQHNISSYQLGVSDTTLIPYPAPEYELQPAYKSIVFDLQTGHQVVPPYTPSYRGDHAYRFVIDTGLVTPGNLHFGVQDGEFSDNSGQYVVEVCQLVRAVNNQAPAANAGPDQAVNELFLVALDGSASADPNADPLTFQWTQVAGPTVALADPLSPTPSFTAPLVPIGGATLTFELIVSDPTGPGTPDTVDITVANVNHAPVALAGNDQAVTEGSAVTLDASNSYDEDGDALGYAWVQLDGPLVTLDTCNPIRPTFNAPYVGPAGAILTFGVLVDDGLDASTDTVVVVVDNLNHPPTASAGIDQTRLEGMVVTLDGSASFDPDNDPLFYLWQQVSGPAVTLSDPAVTAPTFTAPPVSMGGATLVFRLTAFDGYGGFADDDVQITVQAANTPPACGLARPSVAQLWPPNHKMVPITIQGVSDAESAVSITIVGVTQDEPINGLGDGDTAADAVIQGGTLLLRAERAGGGNGRVYRITFEASDGVGGTCIGTVSVSVPHSKSNNAAPPVDDGQFYTSTGP